MTSNLRPQSQTAVIAGSFADYRLVKSRAVLQLVVEIPVEHQAQAFEALGYPVPGTDIPVAVARLKNTPAGPPPPPDRKGTIVADGFNGPQTKPPTSLAGVIAKQRQPWETLSPAQQAGILCSDIGFQKYVSRKTGGPCDEQAVAEWLRSELGVRSRADLPDNPRAVAKLQQIRNEFLQWAGRVPEVR